jgi:hypothetical protein
VKQEKPPAAAGASCLTDLLFSIDTGSSNTPARVGFHAPKITSTYYSDPPIQSMHLVQPARVSRVHYYLQSSMM